MDRSSTTRSESYRIFEFRDGARSFRIPKQVLIYFHGRHFGTAGGLVLCGMGVGGVLGPWLGGHIYDIFGTYKISFILCMVSLLFSTLFLRLAAPRKGPIKASQAECP